MPNFVRASVIPISALFVFAKAHFGLTMGAALVGALIVAIALWALSRLEETFHKELDYHEEDGLGSGLVMPEVGNPSAITEKTK